MIVIPFQPDHMRRINAQEAQRDEFIEDALSPEEITGAAVTGIENDQVMFCGGKAHIDGHWLLWCILAEGSQRHLPRITKVAQRFIRSHLGWLYTLVRPGFKEGDRWVRMLGFELMGKEVEFDGFKADIYRKYC